MVYKKGPYYASEGDFSSVGSAHIHYAREKESNELKFTGGEDGYARALFSGGYSEGDSNWVYALSRTEDDGPWTNPDELERDNAFLKYTRGDSSNGFSISGMYFDSSWNGTDQIPQRLVDNGSLDRFDTLDTGTGGETQRHQLAYQQWLELSDSSRLKANAYWVDYELSLVSNFTYYSADILDVSPVAGVAPEDISDQITQKDDRQLFGGSLSWEKDLSDEQEWVVGFDLRRDDVGNVGIGSSHNGNIYDWSSRSSVEQTSYAAYTSLHSNWNSWFTTLVGVRYDNFDVIVKDKLNGNVKSSDSDELVSPSLSLRFGPFSETEIFLNYGEGFHSNDARGAVKSKAEGGVPLMSESKGYELGVHIAEIENLEINFVLFQLDLDSELVFVGDDGTTEPKDASRRHGIELSAYYKPTDWLVIDADYTKSEAHFKQDQYDGSELLGDYVPDSIEDVFSMGVSVDMDNGLYGGLRLRYFGPRNLTESGDIQSSSSSMVNANLGYAFTGGISLGLEVLNLTDRSDDDITYWYASRTQVERNAGVEPVEDYHSHPMIPRTVRATISYEF